ncbi:shikimate kinase [Campylobacter pinnipediorum]|uniref:shikimate kinase n=1 Tax=Campylobacter pinnipediorum TaxID=1965231 RepID=UPI00099501AF|nr:shikimate kinase [Campylobacter pinnipediorum]
MKGENLVLIGFMGAGKSSVARELAKSLKMFNLDSDNLIENSEGMSIPRIFETKGESYFRDLEKKLCSFLAKNITNAIISTGGGFVNTKSIKQIGKIIYLKSSFEFIIQRLQNGENSKADFEKRPLLKNLDEAKKIFLQREEIYQKKADIVVCIENKTLKQIAKEIKNKIKD